MPSVCLDTNVMIWLFKPAQDDNDEKQKQKAAYLASKLEEDGITPVIPSVVLGELLHGVGASERLSFAAKMQALFQISPFDVPAALEYSYIPSDSNGEAECRREKCKADRMIIATAKAAKCEAIYSEDEHVHHIGSNGIEVRHLPALPERQVPLPNIQIQAIKKKKSKGAN